MAIRSSRCTTSALYQINQTLKDCIKQAVPDLKDREVEHFIEMTSKTLDCSLTDYKNLVRMAQRTHISNLPYCDILFVTNRLISFWVCYIEYFSIDIVISTIIPHSFVDYSLTVACKYLRKKCYCQSPLGTANHSFILDMTNGVNINISKQVSDSFWKGAYDECVAFAENALDKNVKFPYAAERAKRSKKIHKQEKRFLIYDEPYGQNALRYLHSLCQYYRSLCIEDSKLEINEKTNLYFLHYQPEMSTNPLANAYTDQREVISEIASKMPKGHKLYVKEHPHQFYRTNTSFASVKHLEQFLAHRNNEYYTYISRLPNVYLIDNRIPSYELLRSNSIVWVLTGTIGVQALFRDVDVQFLDTLSPYKEIANKLANGESDLTIEEFAKAMADMLVPTIRLSHDYIDSCTYTNSALSIILEQIRKGNGGRI